MGLVWCCHRRVVCSVLFGRLAGAESNLFKAVPDPSDKSPLLLQSSAAGAALFIFATPLSIATGDAFLSRRRAGFLRRGLELAPSSDRCRGARARPRRRGRRGWEAGCHDELVLS